MEVKVDRDRVRIIEEENKIHKGEYKVNEIEYTFSSEYEGLVCKAIFKDSKENVIEAPIINNKSVIPAEILSSGASVCELRVYGYDTEEIEGVTTLKIRYSPSYAEFEIREGSYIEGATASEEVSVSEIDRYIEVLDEKLAIINERLEQIDDILAELNG